jgi:hypothetical protein
LVDARVSGSEALVDKLKQDGRQEPQPECTSRGTCNRLRAGGGRIVLSCQRAGIDQARFITEPPPRGCAGATMASQGAAGSAQKTNPSWTSTPRR